MNKLGKHNYLSLRDVLKEQLEEKVGKTTFERPQLHLKVQLIGKLRVRKEHMKF